jgi:thymidine kinase
MNPRPLPTGTGWIEVVTGCMFSGKTEELIRRLIRARIARQRVVVFKPAVDTRYAVGDVVTHDQARVPCIPVAHASMILDRVGDAEVVGIDEAQFFDADLVRVANALADGGRRVIIAGLDQDFRGEPFEPIPQLLAIAEYITKNLAVCMVCGAPADRSQRLIHREARVVLGAIDAYEARCRTHWRPEPFEIRQEELPLPGRNDDEAGEKPSGAA